jgi:hypothetical protein
MWALPPTNELVILGAPIAQRDGSRSLQVGLPIEVIATVRER